MTTMSPTTKSLLVMVLDERIRTFLMVNDPKAMKQALCALKLVDGIPPEMHEKLNAVAEEVMPVSAPKVVKGNLVVVVGIEDGRFTIRLGGGRVDSSELNSGALARMLVRQGFNPDNENHIIMGSSSIDFPEEDGAPKRFNAHLELQSAILLSTKIR